ALLSPEALQGENQILEGTHGGGCLGHGIYPLLKTGRKFKSIPQIQVFPQRVLLSYSALLMLNGRVRSLYAALWYYFEAIGSIKAELAVGICAKRTAL
ncbi:MAG: hypothetical protein KAZ03_03320, partial [Thiopseudomonas sp.]|nr:hypothetical protein [Thiopseudomonas sp.]